MSVKYSASDETFNNEYVVPLTRRTLHSKTDDESKAASRSRKKLRTDSSFSHVSVGMQENDTVSTNNLDSVPSSKKTKLQANKNHENSKQFHTSDCSKQSLFLAVKTNIVHTLYSRMIGGDYLKQNSCQCRFSRCNESTKIRNQMSMMSSSLIRSKKWNLPLWVSLETPSTRSSITNNLLGSGDIDHISWDRMGVLLAVAINRKICLYDWDMVRAADLRGRRDELRNDHTSEFLIPPIVEFQVLHPVSSLVWNPFDIDELAVGSRVSGQICIYNVDRVSEWLSKDKSRNYRFPPPGENILLKRVTGNVGNIVFLDERTVLVSVGTIIYCWKRSCRNSREQAYRSFSKTVSGSAIWRYQLPSLVTSFARLGSNLIIIGTSRGRMCVIDWTKRMKATLSFSHEHRPEILQTWVPHERLCAPNEDRSLRNMMGILKMRVETNNSECTAGKSYWGRCKVVWVTQSGWLLSMTIESLRSRDNCEVHYSSPQIIYKNAEGKKIDSERRSWSLPHSSIGVDLSNYFMPCWVGTPPITRILSHHDKFVLDSQPTTVVSKERYLLLKSNDSKVQNIPLPGVIKSLPQALAVHPSLEWIVIGEGKRLHIITERGRLKEEATF